MVKLNERQTRFADEYIRLGEVTKAAINAGYSPKTAYAIGKENLEKPSIKAYIEKRLQDLRKQSIAEQDEVLKYLTSVMRGELKDEMLLVVGDETGAAVETHEKRSDTMARTKAAELLGKRYAMWTDKQQIEGVQQVVIQNDLED
ncbi:terminase small subunit [Paenisporosarcina cavernae]|uniref:Terminase small subunit n=1 Tax=Paenisporosarcina cavernae TaxID=2320858 RepID=A0A385YTA5_9BACL|nr:terminase small subunit [Paenisporosarcina cavernae]AYC28713.1 terminase small subunit [Paenisporosarcina cavernae]